MKTAAVLLVLLLVGCCPGTVQSEIEPPPNADEAIGVIAYVYTQATGTNHEVSVFWSDAPLDGRDGFSFSCHEIWVEWQPNQPIHTTALAHEIAHCYAEDVPVSGCGLVNNSHGDDAWWGPDGLVELANEYLIAKSM